MEMEIENGKFLAGVKRRYDISEDESEDDHPSGYKRAKISSRLSSRATRRPRVKKRRVHPGEYMLPGSRYRGFDNARRNDRATAMDLSWDLEVTVSPELEMGEVDDEEEETTPMDESLDLSPTVSEEVDMEEGDEEEEETMAMDESLDLSPTVSEEVEMADWPLEQELLPEQMDLSEGPTEQEPFQLAKTARKRSVSEYLADDTEEVHERPVKRVRFVKDPVHSTSVVYPPVQHIAEDYAAAERNLLAGNGPPAAALAVARVVARHLSAASLPAPVPIDAPAVPGPAVPAAAVALRVPVPAPANVLRYS
ncbi:MAG: hypothetical protein LQ350_003344 [Teloschistes chrysophthalmus]|nr:MAG: hypothetical protein LQ350_003344 [Niorma chrysophthalma]